MSQFSKAHLSALWSVPGIGQQSFKRILQNQKNSEISDQEFWVNKYAIWQKSALSLRQIESIKNFKKEHNFCSFYQTLLDQHVQVLLLRDQAYPSLLKETADAPRVLFVKSQQAVTAATWSGFNLAVVGTRRMTSYGRLVINRLLRDIIQSSQAKIVSGFMYGVDVTAMKLAQQLSRTIGVLAYGFNHCFPQYQSQLMQDMLANGAIFVSEYPPETMPRAGSFVQRNRIIAGLAQLTIVVEAGRKSGSLITAQRALDYDRPVLAIPGPITNPYSRGCCQLLNQGAYLLSSLEDFWRAVKDAGLSEQVYRVASSPSLKQQAKQPSSSKHSASLNQVITQTLTEQGGQLSIDQLVELTQQPREQLLASLFDLQIKQRLSMEGQNYVLSV